MGLLGLVRTIGRFVCSLPCGKRHQMHLHLRNLHRSVFQDHITKTSLQYTFSSSNAHSLHLTNRLYSIIKIKHFVTSHWYKTFDAELGRKHGSSSTRLLGSQPKSATHCVLHLSQQWNARPSRPSRRASLQCSSPWLATHLEVRSNIRNAACRDTTLHWGHFQTGE